MAERALLIGCGDLGLRAARRLRVQGVEVHALRRQPPADDADGIAWLRGDISRPDGIPVLPAGITRLIFLPAPGARDEAVYRGVFVDGLRNVLAALDASHLQRIVFVSSSAVYGEHRGGWVDEDTPPAPQGFNGRILLEAEALLAARPESATALRLAGLYGPGRLQLIERLRSGQAGAPVEPRIGPTASTSMTRRLPSRTWPCCPPSRPCTSAATIRRCHCTSCTPTWRAWRARPRRASRPRPPTWAARNSATRGCAPAACACNGRTRGPAMRRCWPKASAPEPGGRAVSTGAPLIQRHGQAHAWFVPHRIMARDEPGYWRLVPSRARAMPPTDPIAAVTHADPYPYYAALARERPLYRDDTLNLWVASSPQAIAQVLAHPAARVRPPAEPVPRGLCPGPAGALFGRFVRMNDSAEHARLKTLLRAYIDSQPAPDLNGAWPLPRIDAAGVTAT